MAANWNNMLHISVGVKYGFRHKSFINLHQDCYVFFVVFVCLVMCILSSNVGSIDKNKYAVNHLRKHHLNVQYFYLRQLYSSSIIINYWWLLTSYRVHDIYGGGEGCTNNRTFSMLIRGPIQSCIYYDIITCRYIHKEGGGDKSRQYCFKYQPSKHDALKQCRLNVGPASQTVGQQ